MASTVLEDECEIFDTEAYVWLQVEHLKVMPSVERESIEVVQLSTGQWAINYQRKASK